MNVSIKIAACIALAMFLLPVGSAFARDPVDPGSQQTKCIADGGEFSVGDDPKSYDCEYNDGTTWTCDFSGDEPDCDTEFDPDPADATPFVSGHGNDHDDDDD